MAAALAAVEAAETDAHVLVLGGEAFTCADRLPLATLIRYADNDLLGLHHILVKLVDPLQHERMWDAFEALGEEDALEAIQKLIASYTGRPTEQDSPSRAGSTSTARK
jgi:hypothetical protein